MRPRIAAPADPWKPGYLANVRRYIGDWKTYWGEHVPAMMRTTAVPDGSAWGHFPSPAPEVGDSTATFEYNVYLHCFTPAALSGIVFLTGESMVAGDADIPFIYTQPDESLAPDLTRPKQIRGAGTAVPITAWPQLDGVSGAVAR